MDYNRPKPDNIDIYCCRDPFCRFRIRRVMEAHFLATWPRAMWNRLDRGIRTEVYNISKRIEAQKIKRERAL